MSKRKAVTPGASALNQVRKKMEVNYQTLLVIQQEGEARERRIMAHVDEMATEIKNHMTSQVGISVQRLDGRISTQEERVDATMRESRWTSSLAGVVGLVAAAVVGWIDHRSA